MADEHIKVGDIRPWIAHLGDGTTTAFPAGFPFLSGSDVAVWIDGAAQSAGIDFSVTGAGQSAGGTVTLASPPAAGARVVLARATPATRMTDFLPGGMLRADSLNSELDRLTLIVQEHRLLLDGTLRLAPGDGDPAITALPVPAQLAGALLAFDDAGRPVAGPAASLVSGLTGAKDAAEASASSAAASASAASVSAAAASTDATGIAALVQNIPALTTATGDGTTTAFALPQAPVHKRALLITLDGIAQHTDAFSVSETTLTFTAAPPAGVALEIRDLSSTAIVNASDVTAVAAIQSDVAAVAAIHTAISAVAANSSDIAAVAEDLGGANTIGTAITAASGAAASASSASTARIAAEAAQSAAESAQSAAETAEAAAETARTGAQTASTAATASASAAASSTTAAATSATAASDSASAAAASAAAAGEAAASEAARAAFRARFGALPQAGALLSFEAGTMTGLTLSRATEGVRVRPDGLIESIAADTPRAAFDPASGEPLGLLVEAARTNMMKHANLPTGWSTRGSSWTTNYGTAPDGTATSVLITDTATSDVHMIRRVDAHPSIVANTGYCMSCYFRAGTRTKVYLYSPFGSGAGAESVVAWADLATGVAGRPTNAATDDATAWGIEACPGGWYRLWVTGISPSGTANDAYTECAVGMLPDGYDGSGGLSYPGDAAGMIEAWGFQFEEVPDATSGPSSFIGTTGTQVTRAADLASVDLASLPGFRPEGYSLVLECDIGGTQGVLAESGLSGTAEATLELQDGDVHLTGASGLDLEVATGLAHGARIVIAARVRSGGTALSVNGSAVVASTTHTTSGDSDTLALGGDLAGAAGCPLTVHTLAVLGLLSDTRLMEVSGG